MRYLVDVLTERGATLGWLAKQIRVSRQTVYVWSTVPEKRLADVVRVTGIPGARLRPDLLRLMETAESGHRAA